MKSLIVFWMVLFSIEATHAATWPTCGEIQTFFQKKVEKIMQTPDEVRLQEYLANLSSGVFKTAVNYGLAAGFLTIHARPLARASWGGAYRQALQQGLKASSKRKLANQVYRSILAQKMKSSAARYLAGGVVAACAMESAFFLYEENFGQNNVETQDFSPRFLIPSLYVDLWQEGTEEKAPPPALFPPMEADATRIARPAASACDLRQPWAKAGTPLPTAQEEQTCPTYLSPLYEQCFAEGNFKEKILERLFEHPLAENRRFIESVTNALTLQLCYTALSEIRQTEKRRFASRILTQLILIHSQGDLAARLHAK